MVPAGSQKGATVNGKQEQTAAAFGYKWKQGASYSSPEFRAAYSRWLAEKYFDSDPLGPATLLPQDGQRRILDAGCGAGLSALCLFGEYLANHDYVGVDISDAVDQARENFREAGLDGRFLQADILDLPRDIGTFDVILSEGVLHHTPSVESALLSLTRVLRSGGTLLFYVYAKKSPVREFTDDFVRERLMEMDDEAAWEALLPLTQLGKILGDLNVTVDLHEDIDVLSIPRGRYNLQRLVYYKFCKMFYNPNFTIEEMNHINFDWFRPLNCHRHSAAEIRQMCERQGLAVRRFHEEESGFSVIAEKQ